ncbi:ROK family protein [Mycoplasma capricolum]|uniref:ROK family protein n=1 Tax=Mycoplasma capricolum subsp. capripneumoniae 87001 TaxID=1124992 RepID=A0A9N7BAB5_MYCCC|nr:ROK family protein [Mycoplasma capricolum]AJK51459.1 ROK family protein [Mycoplasma capricolum subsp. capripneumoniae 87001]AQU77511.1 sugar kinase [Mycoplasma capricolum subsp. capripneumoniae]QIN43073.1 ROK family protein [Mycoplasma capricolum subsp. capripneumoniae]QIN43756.1 ROK family protein [Mycoplasma capricolum subsp. capripneumoniae]QIN44443.1 ROK family protein [Mycoplasma capricolum subsp. capripneumoniae]
MTNIKKYLSIDIGGTSIKYGMFNQELQPIFTNSIKTIPIKDELIKQLIDIIGSNLPFDGIGIATTGVVDKNGVIKFANQNIKNYSNFDLKTYIKDFLISCKNLVPIEIINDANSASYIEYVNDKKIKNSITLTLGTGVGMGIILNEKLFLGNNGIAGEIAAIKNSNKIIDTELSWSKFIEKLNQQKYHYDSSDIWTLYNQNDFYKEQIDIYLDKLVNLLCTISYLLSPEVIYLGGGFSYCSEQILELINIRFKKEFVFYNINPIQIKYTLNKNDSGILGVLHLLVDKHFKN